MNNAHLYTLVTQLEKAERTYLLAGQEHTRQSVWCKTIAAIELLIHWWQRLKTSEQTPPAQPVADPGITSWRPSAAVAVDPPRRVE